MAPLPSWQGLRAIGEVVRATVRKVCSAVGSPAPAEVEALRSFVEGEEPRWFGAMRTFPRVPEPAAPDEPPVTYDAVAVALASGDRETRPEDVDRVMTEINEGHSRGAITNRTRFRMSALAYLRKEMPYASRIRGNMEATRRVAEKKLAAWMKERHVRDVDAARHMPSLVAMLFVPSAEDRAVADWLRDGSVKEWRRRALDGPRRPWWAFWMQRSRGMLDESY